MFPPSDVWFDSDTNKKYMAAYNMIFCLTVDIPAKYMGAYRFLYLLLHIVYVCTCDMHMD